MNQTDYQDRIRASAARVSAPPAEMETLLRALDEAKLLVGA